MDITVEHRTRGVYVTPAYAPDGALIGVNVVAERERVYRDGEQTYATIKLPPIQAAWEQLPPEVQAALATIEQAIDAAEAARG